MNALVRPDAAQARRPAARLRGLLVLALLVLAALPASGAGFQDLESQVRQFTLPNGLTFLVLERHDAPVFSFRTYVAAGGANEVAGITGIAHMFEHMAFKGTETVGTTDAEAEARALDAVDAAWLAYAEEMRKGYQADSTKLGELEAAFKEAQEAARQYVVSNDFGKVVEESGGRDMNAFTMMDHTQYFYSLPSNRLAVWARLEGDRLTDPVLREFYTERDVVKEERRFQESSPMGRVFSQWWIASYLAHPYGNGLIGHPSDLSQITRQDAQEFFDTHYVGPNITVAVVGDVKFDEVKKLAETYFSGVRSAPKPPPVRTAEPPHTAEIRITVEEDAQPMVVIGYHIPGVQHPDWIAYDLLGGLLGSGRSSRIYERLVKQDQSAVNVGGGAGFPGYRYPNMMLFQAVVSKEATTDQVETALHEELARFVEEGPSADEVAKVKARTKASFIRSLRSNSGLAGELAEMHGMQGDWRKLFDYLDRVEAVTAQDLQRIARETFRKENRTVAILKKPEA